MVYEVEKTPELCTGTCMMDEEKGLPWERPGRRLLQKVWGLIPGSGCRGNEGKKMRTTAEKPNRLSQDQCQTQGETERASSVNLPPSSDL